MNKKLIFSLAISFSIAITMLFFFSNNSVIVGGSIGLLIGGVYGLFLHFIKRKVFKCNDVGGMITGRELLLHDLSIKEARALSVKAIRKLNKASINEKDSRINIITAATGLGWKSFGENILFEFTDTKDGVQVKIESKPKLLGTIEDYGKNRENLEIMTKFLISTQRT